MDAWIVIEFDGQRADHLAAYSSDDIEEIARHTLRTHTFTICGLTTGAIGIVRGRLQP